MSDILLSDADISRFWSKVETNGSDSPCWEWQAARNAHGYGQFSVSGKTRPAHRVSYVIAHGAIPDGYLICHHCDNPSCVRPAHLFAGTQSDNRRDCIRKGRHWGLPGMALTTYRPSDGESTTAAYSLPRRLVEWVAMTAARENATKSLIVMRAIERLKAEAEKEEAA